MWTFLGRPECILCLSSALCATALLTNNQLPRLNQTHLNPLLLITRKVGLEIKDSEFTLEGYPFRIISGTIDYFRIPRHSWRLSLRKLQSCGFNTLTTHIPWNLHEPAVGYFRFTENVDLIAFITMASETGLWVIVCPGPYIGGDLDLGGLPSWLLRDPKMKLRTTYKGFTKAMNRYFDNLIPRIAKYQFKKGGPIIAVQIENEYGSYYMDKKYLAYVKTALESRGINELLLTADDGASLKKGHLQNVLSTIHMKNIKKETYEDLKSIQENSPILMMVYTANSFDTWGALRQLGDPQMLMKDVREMFRLGFSLNFYMFQGGTNFGLIGGAHFSQGYMPVVTSYDYSALISEGGEYTLEYQEFQHFFHSVTDNTAPIQPKATLMFAYQTLTLLYFMTLWDFLPYLVKITKSIRPLSMEQLPGNDRSGQSFGYILYETKIFGGGILSSKGHVQGRGQVFLDNNYVGLLDQTNHELLLFKDVSKKTQILRILVENQGRLSSGQDMNKERKGLTGDIYLEKSPLRPFKIYSLEMKDIFIQREFPKSWKKVTGHVQGPAFFLSHLRAGDPPQDTFIKIKGWGKGVISINGRSLGRYWNVGPQETIYVPGSLLHPGVNKIIIFEELRGDVNIRFTNRAQLGTLDEAAWKRAGKVMKTWIPERKDEEDEGQVPENAVMFWLVDDESPVWIPDHLVKSYTPNAEKQEVPSQLPTMKAESEVCLIPDDARQL
ncbi:beta-galactosidase-1-like protein 2 [Apodemus sylvaticus]|uniref:beta-galactosidase-1-like protein 2 n=1 Tax=Apodemus sylvaticus TaxID=10129 RepID=UPI002242D0D6|nr:beta-galactosidase-1-like protein 2 [Apodemus sylvaticus]